MNRKKNINLYVVSDFNAQNLKAILNNQTTPDIDLHAEIAPYGQTIRALSEISQDEEKSIYEYVIVWSIFEKISELNVYDSSYPTDEIIANNIDKFCFLLEAAAKKCKELYVPLWTLPDYIHTFCSTDIKNSKSITYKLLSANMRLIENLKHIPNICILNTNKWCEIAGAHKAYNPKLWYMGKISFGNEVFKNAASDIISHIESTLGITKKLIILDLDNTLWGGVLGDVGKSNLALGGHDPVGESFRDFQKALKSLKQKGILLAIASKNDEAPALDAITTHPEMILELKDFAAWQINWQDKALNIATMVKNLGLGLQSAVFIDDNPTERARVREALPEVYVPEWPEDKMLYSKTLMELNCFSGNAITEEDLQRTEYYFANKKRDSAKTEAISFDGWLNTLGTQIQAEPLNSDNLIRVLQLFNKTNQMNLTTRRMTESELKGWADVPGNFVWAFRVKDKFGDLGLTGIVGFTISGEQAMITDFILSCRIIGRKIEQTILHFAETEIIKMKVNEIRAQYVQTEKNDVCFNFWLNDSAYQYNKEYNLFSKKATAPIPLPECIILNNQKTN